MPAAVRSHVRGWIESGRLGWPDLAVAAALLALGQLEVALRGVAGDPLASHLVWAAIAVAALFRRAAPLAFALLTLGTLFLRGQFGLSPDGGAIQGIVMPLSIFGVGLYGREPRRSAAFALAIALATIFVYWLPEGLGSAYATAKVNFEWLRIVTVALGAALAGIALRDRSEAVRQARARVASMPPAESEVDASLARARREIAGDLQGVVTRCLERIEAAVSRGRAAVARDPAATAREAERAMAESREAMGEMRRMLNLLRGGRAEAAPAAGEALAGGPGDRPSRRAASALSWLALPLVILVSGVLNALFLDHLGLGEISLAGRLAGAVAMTAVFLPWRRAPLVTVLGVGLLIHLRVAVLDDRFPFDIFIWSALFIAGAYARPVWAGALAGAATLAASMHTVGQTEPFTPFGYFIAFNSLAVAAWALGLSVRRRLAQLDELHELEREEHRRREDLARRAVEGERLRVARELHDLIGHGLTTITLQCAAASRSAEADPEAAAGCLATVEGLSAEVSSELDELTAALDGNRDAAPPPVAEADRLFRLGAGGRLEIEGDLASVPAGQSGAAYRILQEAVTNARKHGRPGTVVARVRRSGDLIRLEVENAMGHRDGRAAGGGHGLVGMRERAEIYGGALEVGPRGPGGWRVVAELPLAPAGEIEAQAAAR